MADEKTSVVAGAGKDAKVKKSTKKSGQGNKIGKFIRELRSEFKKIVWPTFPTVVRNSLVTLLMCVLLGLVVFAVDSVLGLLVNLLLSLG